MVVALSASQAQAEEGFARYLRDLVQHDLSLHTRLTLVPFVDPVTQECRGDEGFWVVGGKFVGGQLFANELVVGLVGVERTYDVIPIKVGSGTKAVRPVAVGIRITGHVQPMRGPAFAIAR